MGAARNHGDHAQATAGRDVEHDSLRASQSARSAEGARREDQAPRERADLQCSPRRLRPPARPRAPPTARGRGRHVAPIAHSHTRPPEPATGGNRARDALYDQEQCAAIFVHDRARVLVNDVLHEPRDSAESLPKAFATPVGAVAKGRESRSWCWRSTPAATCSHDGVVRRMVTTETVTWWVRGNAIRSRQVSGRPGGPGRTKRVD